MKNKTLWITGFVCLAVVFAAAAAVLGVNEGFFERREGSISADAAEKESAPLVVIDPGHGGEDGGCSAADGTVEKELNLSISENIAAILNAAGCKTVLTRTEDTLLYDMYGDLSDYKGHKKVYDLRNRLRFSEESGARVLVSVHMNKFTDSKYSGLQVYYSPNDSSSVSLADMIQSQTAAHLQPDNDRKTKKAGKNIYLLDRIEFPAVMVECGFLSNAEEAKNLSDATYRKKLALCISSAALEFLAKKSDG